ncbi:SPOSA6832_03603 [Sporobolomyces salmonicolor]|uniref:SPOSA6832_03603-mRNA-1:cds n=1 Tax=Sporidiobolus salmonicolor TaxID=5005 RepID=A0A0D6EPW9_SPOSA|nr:SPOSA6832_03603 [Sporobolomyces salmonicolor]
MAPPRFSVDDVNRLLDRFPFSVPSAVCITLYSFFKARAVLGNSHHLADHLRSHRWLSLLLAFVALKTLHRTLTRLTRNHGWKADPPTWSMEKGKGDVVLITGGSTGIGKEMVEMLATKTSNIAVLDLAEPTYQAKNVKYYRCDVTDPRAIAEVAKKVRAEIGEPTVLINNAGIARGKTILDTKPEEFLLTYKVNVLGAHNILREFLPHSQFRSRHLETASSASYAAIPQLSELDLTNEPGPTQVDLPFLGTGEYACSKAAVLALHETLTGELRHRYDAPRVRTSVICPTKVGTQMGDAMRDTDNQFLTPTLDAKWLAREMVRIIDSGLSDHLVTPHFAHLLLPSLRSGPEYFRWFVNKVRAV